MGLKLEPLVVAVSSRALFDLREESRVFTEEGEEAYVALQKSRAAVPVSFGSAYPLVRRLLALNEHSSGAPLVQVVLASRNDPHTGARIMQTLDDSGLAVEQAFFTTGRPVAPYLKALGAGLFLSCEEEDVTAALEAGLAAARGIEGDAALDHEHDDGSVRVAFDGDCVLFGESAERIFQEGGVEGFHAHERANAQAPIEPGPFAPFLRALNRIQQRCPKGAVRTSLVTARAVAAHARAMATLNAMGVSVDEAFFLSGGDKAEVLRTFGCHFFFDDSNRHVASAARVVPTGQVVTPLRRQELKLAK